MKKNNTIIVVLFLMISFIVSLFFEVIIDNREVLNKATIKNPKVLETKNILVDNNKYITTDKYSYIVLDVPTNYINNIKFDYKSKKDFNLNAIYNVKSKEISTIFSTSKYLNKAVKKIHTSTSKIKIEFNKKNIKIKNICIDNDFYLDWSKVIFITFSIFIILMIIKFRKYFINNIDILFLFLSLVFCFIMVNILPKNVYVSFDDQIHFKRSIQFFSTESEKYSKAEQVVYEGNIYRDNIYLSSKQEKEVFYDYINNEHKKTKNRKVFSPHSSLINRIIYLPFSIGYELGNALNLKLTTCITMAKMLNAIVYCLIMFLAIRLSKYGKKILFLIGLLPTNLFFATQFSYDPNITSALILSSALFINMLSREKINKKELLVFIISTVWACLPKAIYCPILLLLLFIPNKKFSSKKQAYILKGLIVFITILLLSTFVLPAASGSMGGDARGGNTSVTKQLHLIINNPLHYSKVLILFSCSNIFKLLMGSGNFVSFAYVHTKCSLEFIYGIVLIIFLYFCITDKNCKEVNNFYKFIFGLLILGLWVLICTSLYLSFTPIGLNTINGVQSRYFIPILFLLSQILNIKVSKTIKDDYLIYAFIAIELFIMFVLLFSIY